MVRTLEDVRMKFHNRREWRHVAAAGQVVTPPTNLLEVLCAGMRRLRELEGATPVAKALT